jgi:hypothetical protein
MGDQISAGDIINAESIAIGREAIAVKTTGNLTIYKRPAYYPRLDYRSEISDLVSYYTQSFVGRIAEVQQLTHFAAQESSGYLLVEALSGYGKSALMFHLLHRHEFDRWGFISEALPCLFLHSAAGQAQHSSCFSTVAQLPATENSEFTWWCSHRFGCFV